MNFCDVAVILLQIVGHPVLKSIYGIITITLSAFIVKQVITFDSGDTLHRSDSLCCGGSGTKCPRTGIYFIQIEESTGKHMLCKPNPAPNFPHASIYLSNRTVF